MGSRFVKLLVVHLSLFGTLFAFQNCSQQFKATEELGQAIDNSVLGSPQITFVDTPEYVNGSSVAVEFSVTPPSGDSLQSVSCQIGDNMLQDCSSGSVSYNNLVDGDYSFRVVAVTTKGGRNEETRVFRKDTTAPVITVSSTPPSVTSSLAGSFIYTTSDNLSGVMSAECSLNNAAFSNCASPANVSNLSSGAHNFRIRATDRAGNVSTVYSYSWTINLTVPTVTISSSPSSFTNSVNATFQFSGSNLVSYQCQINDGAFANCTSPHTVTNLAPNLAYVFRVRGTNNVGTVSANTEARWTIDTSAPSVPQITANVPAITQLRGASLSFSSSDTLAGLARFECSVNSGAFAICTSPRAFTNVVDGQQMLTVRAVDNAGNISQTGSFSWVIDGTNPTLAFTQTPAASTTATTASFSFTSADSGSGLSAVQCSLDLAAFVNCTSPYGLSNLSVASHELRVRATDRAGNQVMISHSWVVNTEVVVPPPSGNVQPRLAANRVTGVAPLAVQFDASTSTANGVTIPFHFLRYDFNFGDDRGQTWAVSSLPKNTQSGGPIAAHVFDNPGTYTVRVRARNPASTDNAEATITVTVQDPNTVYSGTNTICVSTSANYTDCPAGAIRQTTVPSIQSQKRILLRRGESFGGISINHGVNNVLITAFGTGNKPRVNSISIGALNPSSSSFPSDISTVDLNIQNGYSQYVTGSRLLIYRCDFDVPQGPDLVIGQIEIGSALGYIVQNHTLAANQYYQPREIFVVENTLFGSTANPHVNMVGEGSQFVIMGNRMGIAQQHTIRLFAMNKGFIAHNHLRGISSDGIRVALKLQSGGLGDYNDNYAISRSTWATRQVVISNNMLGDTASNNSFTGGASPENTLEAQGLEDVILENNRFIRGPNTNTEFILMGRRMSNRGNVRVDGGAVNINQFGNQYNLPAEWNGPYYNSP